MPKKKKARKSRLLRHPQEEAEEELPHPESHKMSEKELEPQSPAQSQDQLQNQQPQQLLEVEEESPDQQLPQQELVDLAQDMAVSPPLSPVHDTKAPSPVSRKPSGKKKKPVSEKRRIAIQEKLDLLERNLKPVPFAPGTTLDFSRHERLFRSLGLWDFVHLQLDREIRSDLLALLIANYDPSPNRCSFVNEARVAVSRANLARALSLSVKKEKVNPLEGKDSDNELFAEEESVAVIMDFMSNWVLLHEDACILPGDVMAAIQLVKEGQLQKVDWATLIWTMVENELLEVPRSGLCYYASHLQCLMRHQKPGLFKEVVEEDPSMEVPLVEQADEVPLVEEVVEVPLVEEEEKVAACGSTSIGNVEDLGFPDSGKQGAGLSLDMGQGEDLMEEDTGECKVEEEEQEQWFPGGKNEEGAHSLRPCNLNDVQSMGCEDVCKEGGSGVGEEDIYDGDLTSKFPLERLASTDLLQAMDTVNISFCPQMQPLDPLAGEFLASRADTVQSVDLNPCPGGSSLFGNTGKRDFGEIDDDDDNDDNDIHHFHHGDHQKRMRNDVPWNQMQIPSTFDACMEQVQCWMGKAKMVLAEKEQECMNVQLQVQYLNSMLLQKEHLIKALEKSKLEEQQKRHAVVCQFEHELGVMVRIVHGHKKALGETRRAFAEYRKQFPQGDEPLYKDVGEAGGIVLSMRELERQRLESEEIVRSMATQMSNDFLKECSVMCDGFADRIQHMAERLPKIEEGYDLVKKWFTESKGSDGIPK